MELREDRFEQWMSRLAERLDRQEKMLQRLTSKEDLAVHVLDGERLLDNQDVCMMLQVSKRSLQRYRSTGLLRYRMLGHKLYYRESDIRDFVQSNFEVIGGRVRRCGSAEPESEGKPESK